MVFQFSQYYLLKTLSFLHCVILAPFSKIIFPYTCGFISRHSILFHCSVSVVLPIPCCFNYCCFVEQLEVPEYSISSFVIFLGLLWLFEVFCDSIQMTQKSLFWVTIKIFKKHLLAKIYAFLCSSQHHSWYPTHGNNWIVFQ